MTTMPQVRERRLIHSGRKFDFVEVDLDAPGGRTITRQMVEHPGAVCVCAVLETDDGPAVVFIRNERFSVGETLLELCAGTLEAGEDPAACAGRELIEETGYEAREIVALGSFFTTPGMTNERMYAFCATGLTHVGQRLEEDEAIEVEIVPAARAMEMLDAGELADAKSIVTLVRAMRRGLLGEFDLGGGSR